MSYNIDIRELLLNNDFQFTCCLPGIGFYLILIAPFIFPFQKRRTLLIKLYGKPYVPAIDRIFRNPAVRHKDKLTVFSGNRKNVSTLRLSLIHISEPTRLGMI